MRSFIKYSVYTGIALMVSTATQAASGPLSAETFFEPHFWVIAAAVVGVFGLAAGNGISSPKAPSGPRPYADHLHAKVPALAE